MLLVAYSYFFIYNKSHVDTLTAKADHELEAIELYQHFSKDEVTANKKYLGSILKIEGVILDIEYTAGKISAIRLDVGDILDAVVCEADPIYKREMPDLKVGDQLIVQGVCTGFLDDVIINRCVVLEIKNRPND